MLSAFLFLVSLVSALPRSPTNFQSGQKVLTTSGQVQGHASSWRPNVSEYLGIPYAQPPTGALRFAPPKPYTIGSNTTYTASNFSPDCPANVASAPGASISYSSVAATISGILGQAGDTFDEDCLTVNVWTKPQSGERSKAVMIWIYGGGFNTGNSQSPAYNGARLAEDQDVVVVSINYRINIFGFPGARFLPDLNPGLLDQRLAVEWVRDNIAAFGGDPKRIILFGQSAGGASVDFYSYAWTADPIVYGFIPESGSASNREQPSGTNSSSAWFAASKALNCGGEEAGEKSLACMRTKEWKDILKAIKSVGGAAGRGAFGPKADGRTVFADYAARRAAGNFIKAPILVGNTDDEGGLSVLTANMGNAAPKTSGSAVSVTVPPPPPPPPAPQVTPPSAPPAPQSKPPSLSPATNSIGSFHQSGASIGRLLRRQTAPSPPDLSRIGCSPHSAALGRIKAGVPAWRYVYHGVWPNQDIGSKGAWHGADIGIHFGTTEFLSRKPDTEEERKMITTVMGAWGAFAKDPKDGLRKFGWPVYDENKPTVIAIGGRDNASVKFVDRKVYDANCPA